MSNQRIRAATVMERAAQQPANPSRDSSHSRPDSRVPNPAARSEPRPQGSGGGPSAFGIRNSESRSVFSRTPNPESRSHGFTLLEVLVATVILGTAVAALFSLLSGSLGNMGKLRAPEQALLLGQSRMNELLAARFEAPLAGETEELPLDQKLEGRWDEEFRWEAFATRHRPSPERESGIILVRITLDVFWRSRPGEPERKLSLETYQLRHAPSGTVQ